MNFIVQKGVQRKTSNTRRRTPRFPFGTMLVDDSFPLNGTKRATVYAAARRFVSQNPSWHFSVGLAEDGHLHCWRDK